VNVFATDVNASCAGLWIMYLQRNFKFWVYKYGKGVFAARRIGGTSFPPDC